MLRPGPGTMLGPRPHSRSPARNYGPGGMGRDEGQILPGLLVVLLALLAVGMLMFQVGKAAVLRSEAQTAADAAAVGGAGIGPGPGGVGGGGTGRVPRIWGDEWKALGKRIHKGAPVCADVVTLGRFLQSKGFAISENAYFGGITAQHEPGGWH